MLEILDFVLTNSAPIFRSLPAFENTLSVWISQLLQSQLQVIYLFFLDALRLCWHLVLPGRAVPVIEGGNG